MGRKNFVQLRETQLFYLVIKLTKPRAVPKTCTRWKLREVSVLSFSRADNYDVVMAVDFGEIQSSHWQSIMALEEWFKMFSMQCKKDARDASMWIDSIMAMNKSSSSIHLGTTLGPKWTKTTNYASVLTTLEIANDASRYHGFTKMGIIHDFDISTSHWNSHKLWFYWTAWEYFMALMAKTKAYSIPFI